MSQFTHPPLNSRTKAAELSPIVSSLGFTIDDKRVDAKTYETENHSLGRHFRLLAPIRMTELVSYGQVTGDLNATLHYRIMGTLWYGMVYQYGFVIEIFGEDIQPHMTDCAQQLSKIFDTDVPVMVRTLRQPHFV